MFGSSPLDTSALQRSVSPKTVRRAFGSALGKIAQRSKTAISRRARQRYAIQAASINRVFRMERKPGLEGRVLRYAGARIGLDHFDARETRVSGKGTRVSRMGRNGIATRRVRTSKRHQNGVTVRILRQEGRKQVVGRQGFGAFMAPVGFGNILAVRSTEQRLPIKKLFGPSIAEMVGHETVAPAFDETVRDIGPLEFERAMKFFSEK